MEIKLPKTLFGDDGRKALERILSEGDEVLRSDNFGGSSVVVKGRYDFVTDLNYAKALGVLRRDYSSGRIPGHPVYVFPDGKKVIRPLSLRETALARMNDYETLRDVDGSVRSDEDRLKLFNKWSFTCSGIAYHKGSSKCKILPVSEVLVTIAEDYDHAFIPINYANVNGFEIDTSAGKYNQALPLSEVLENAGWVESFELDRRALTDYAGLVFRLLKDPGKAMGFSVGGNTNIDELRPFVFGGLFNDSLAGDGILDYNARFVRVNP